MWEQYCSCPWCDGYKTWRCIQEIHTRRDTNCQHTSKFTTLTKPRPYFLSLWRALRRNLCFLCLALPCTSADEMQGSEKSALQLGAENPTNVQIPKPTIVGTNENIFRESSTLMSFLLCPHSAIHQFTKYFTALQSSGVRFNHLGISNNWIAQAYGPCGSKCKPGLMT